MKFKSIRQIDKTDCAASCISMIANYYNKNISISKARELSCTDRNGTSIPGIIQAFLHMDIDSKGVRFDKINAVYLSEIPNLPLIAHIITSSNIPHYVIIFKTDKKYVYIADPEKGIEKISHEEFLRSATGMLVLAKPNKNFKPDNFTPKSSVLKYLGLLLMGKKAVVLTFFFSCVITVSNLSIAFYFKQIIDKFLPNSDQFKLLTELSLLILLISVIGCVSQYIRGKLLLKLGNNISYKLMSDYFGKIMKLPISFFEHRETGDIISRFKDISYIQDSISQMTLSALFDIVMVFTCATILLIICQPMFIIAIISLLIYVPVSMLFQKKFSKDSRKLILKDSKLNDFLFQFVSGIKTVKCLSNESNVLNSGERKFSDLLNSFYKFGNSKNLQTAIRGGIRNLTIISSFWAGSLTIANTGLGAGTLIVGYTIVTFFIDPVERLSGLQSSFNSAMHSITRFFDVLESESEENGTVIFEKFNSKIIFNDVSFNYTILQPILENVNLQILKGQKTAIIGESGSGKTSLAQLTTGLYKPLSGEIMIDGINIKEFDKRALRKKFHMFPKKIYYLVARLWKIYYQQWSLSLKTKLFQFVKQLKYTIL